MEDGEIECSIKPEEIPEIPQNKFLLRRVASPQENADAKDDRQPERDRNSDRRRDDSDDRYRHQARTSSGRKIKGRGFRVRETFLKVKTWFNFCLCVCSDIELRHRITRDLVVKHRLTGEWLRRELSH